MFAPYFVCLLRPTHNPVCTSWQVGPVIPAQYSPQYIIRKPASQHACYLQYPFAQSIRPWAYSLT